MTTTGVILIKDHTLKGNAEHSVHIAQLGKQVHRGERTVLKQCVIEIRIPKSCP